MKFSPFINKTAKYLVILILVAAFILTLFWLWQRQPRVQNLQTPQETKDSQSVQTPESFKITPPDGSVLTSKQVKLTGQAKAGYLAIFSNNFQILIKTDQNGEFEKEVDLADGLNLITLISFSDQLKQDQEKSLVYLLAKDTKDGETIFAGPVKTILDNLLTIASSNGQKNIRSTKNTNITLPKPPASEKTNNESTGSAIQNIRVGDFLIAQGNLSAGEKDEMTAKKIEVIREDKPQNNQKIMLGRILISPRQNLPAGRQGLFSVKDSTTNEIIEFSVTSDTQILQEEKEAKTEDITKNKSAFVIYHQENDKNLVDLIYLLP